MIRLATGMIDGQLEFERVTPKRYAQDFIRAALQGKIECMDLDDECQHEMTEREMRLVEDQIVKLAERVYKMVGYG